jgi:hypothetical protein
MRLRRLWRARETYPPPFARRTPVPSPAPHGTGVFYFAPGRHRLAKEKARPKPRREGKEQDVASVTRRRAPRQPGTLGIQGPAG